MFYSLQSVVAIGGVRGQNRSIKLKSSYVSWQNCDKEIPALPEKICYHGCVIVNGHLFIAGGLVYHGHHQTPRLANSNKKQEQEVGGKIHAKSYWFDATNKKWQQLAYMKRARKNPVLVHMDDCVYGIGGTGKGGGPSNHVDCFSLSSKKWYNVTKMPFPIKDPSAVVFKGKVLVYGMRDRNDTYALLMYSPGKPEASVSCVPVPGKWYLLRTEKHAGNCTGIYKPVLTVQDGKCYRVVYEVQTTKSESGGEDSVKRKARIHEVVCDFDAQVPSASVGGEEKQNEELMKHIIGTVNFCINDRLFVNACGLVYRTELTVADTSSRKAEDYLWIHLGKDTEMLGASVVLHTYED